MSKTSQPADAPLSSLIMAVALVALLLTTVPIALASDAKNLPRWVLGVGCFYYAVFWFFNFLMVLDSAAFLYGFNRPYLSDRKPLTFVLSPPSVSTPGSFVRTSLSSFFLTLYGFMLAYIALSSFDSAAFTEPMRFVTALYFTLGTASTAGAGEIAPKTDLARLLVSAQFLATLVYTLFILAGIVALATSSHGADDST